MNFFKRLSLARLRRTPTRNQWFASVANMQRLREIVTDDTFIAACNFLLDERRINESDVFNNPTLLPLRAAHSAGYSLFLRDLESLAKVPQQQTVIPEEWDYLEETDNV